jgi:hypothetical protein
MSASVQLPDERATRAERDRILSFSSRPLHVPRSVATSTFAIVRQSLVGRLINKALTQHVKMRQFATAITDLGYSFQFEQSQPSISSSLAMFLAKIP